MPKPVRMMKLSAPKAGQKPVSNKNMNGALTGKKPAPYKKFKPEAAEHYYAVESARGLFGMYIVADGTDTPSRIKLRTPSFSNLGSMVDVLPGTPIADTITIVGSIDVVMPEIDR